MKQSPKRNTVVTAIATKEMIVVDAIFSPRNEGILKRGMQSNI
jgi:hypothetical protein